MKEHPRIHDERIDKTSNKMGTALYIYMLPLLTVQLIVKLKTGIPFERYLIEILCLSISIAYMITAMIRYRINLFTKSDSALYEIKAKILSQCGMICFWIVIAGEFILLLLGCLHSSDILLYIITWGIPALFITFYSIKKGLLIWGGTGRKKSGKEALARRTAIGALFFGITLGGPKFYFDGTFHAGGLLWIFGMALGWGIPFYLIFCSIISLGEKNADKQVEDAELEAGIIHEKQADENCQNRK